MKTPRYESRLSNQATSPRFTAALGLWAAHLPIVPVGVSGSTFALQEDSFEIVGETEPLEHSWRLVELEIDLWRLDLRARPSVS